MITGKPRKENRRSLGHFESFCVCVCVRASLLPPWQSTHVLHYTCVSFMVFELSLRLLLSSHFLLQLFLFLPRPSVSQKHLSPSNQPFVRPAEASNMLTLISIQTHSLCPNSHSAARGVNAASMPERGPAPWSGTTPVKVCAAGSQ